jgi:hypothetical protein
VLHGMPILCVISLVYTFCNVRAVLEHMALPWRHGGLGLCRTSTLESHAALCPQLHRKSGPMPSM